MKKKNRSTDNNKQTENANTHTIDKKTQRENKITALILDQDRMPLDSLASKRIGKGDTVLDSPPTHARLPF